MLEEELGELFSLTGSLTSLSLSSFVSDCRLSSFSISCVVKLFNKSRISSKYSWGVICSSFSFVERCCSVFAFLDSVLGGGDVDLSRMPSFRVVGGGDVDLFFRPCGILLGNLYLEDTGLLLSAGGDIGLRGLRDGILRLLNAVYV